MFYITSPLVFLIFHDFLNQLKDDNRKHYMVIISDFFLKICVRNNMIDINAFFIEVEDCTLYRLSYKSLTERALAKDFKTHLQYTIICDLSLIIL